MKRIVLAAGCTSSALLEFCGKFIFQNIVIQFFICIRLLHGKLKATSPVFNFMSLNCYMLPCSLGFFSEHVQRIWESPQFGLTFGGHSQLEL